MSKLLRMSVAAAAVLTLAVPVAVSHHHETHDSRVVQADEHWCC